MKLDEKILDELRASIPDYSDEEILEIIKKRKHYQQKVAEMAIEEAIRRGIIFSRDDLHAHEYRVEPLKVSLFPFIEKEEIRTRMIRSLARGVLLVGIIPTIFGFLRVAEHKLFEAFILLCLGGIWILSAAFFMRTRHRRYVVYLLVITSLSMIYIIFVLIGLKPFRFMDAFVAVVLYGIIVYSLFYLKKLIREEKP